MAQVRKQANLAKSAGFSDQEINKITVPKTVFDSIKEDYSKNRCKRCKGFMVTDYPQLAFSSDGGDGGMLIGARHCLICGDIIDPIIILNRYLHNSKNGLIAEKK